MLVPVGCEHDWIFSTQTSHLHLLLSSSCSSLILVGNLPYEPQPKPKPYTRSISSDPDPIHQFQSSILPLLLALSPKSAFTSCIPHMPFLSCHDDVARIVTLDHLVGPVVGEMLVEEVELDGGESRRRLRFKRMSNLRFSRNGNGKRNGIEPVSVPEQFLCPISSEIMKDPVVLASGQTYDQPFIQEWLNSGNRTCPQTYDRPFIQATVLKGKIELGWL